MKKLKVIRWRPDPDRPGEYRQVDTIDEETRQRMAEILAKSFQDSINARPELILGIPTVSSVEK